MQGFVTGLATDPNAASASAAPGEQLATLLEISDWVRFSLAGCLR